MIAVLGLALLVGVQADTGRTALVTVRDAQGRALVDVGVDDFVVREGDETREALDAHIADYPIAIVIDNSAAAAMDFEAIRKAAIRFINRVGQRPISIRALADPITAVASFDDERSVLLKKLEALQPNAARPPRLLETVADTADMVRKTEAPFAAIVVLSAASDDAIGTDAAGPLLSRALESRAAVHAVAIRKPGQPPSGDLLRGLSDQTKGRFTTIFSVASFQAALDRLADQFATEMMIYYLVPAGASSGPGNDVKIGVQLPGARVEGLGVR